MLDHGHRDHLANVVDVVLIGHHDKEYQEAVGVLVGTRQGLVGTRERILVSPDNFYNFGAFNGHRSPSTKSNIKGL